MKSIFVFILSMSITQIAFAGGYIEPIVCDYNYSSDVTSHFFGKWDEYKCSAKGQSDTEGKVLIECHHQSGIHKIKNLKVGAGLLSEYINQFISSEDNEDKRQRAIQEALKASIKKSYEYTECLTYSAYQSRDKESIDKKIEFINLNPASIAEGSSIESPNSNVQVNESQNGSYFSEIGSSASNVVQSSVVQQ